MGNYIIGGWTQDLNATAPESFSYVMYGMVTNLKSLTTGGGWGPDTTNPPQNTAKVMWSYGGAGAAPENMPATEQDMARIIQATNDRDWAGVDFDDESNMNRDNMIQCMQLLQGKQRSFTFLAGWAYNNPSQSPEGQQINDNVNLIAQAGVCDRFALMCYADAMWDMPTIEGNVPQAIERTLAYVKDSKKVILALTPDGLTNENLDYFLNQVVTKELGGLFIWEYPRLDAAYLQKIENTLGVKQSV